METPFFMKKFSLGRHQIIKSKKQFELLFSEGESIKEGALILQYLPSENLHRNLVAFSVPKRNFKRAVDRIQIKRWLRESYRLNQEEFSGDAKYLLLFIFKGRNIPDYQYVNRKIISIATRFKSL